MPIRLDITLLSGRYDAGGGDDPRAVEWPPHPARVFSALRAVASDDELAPLAELERLSPPLIHASAAGAYRTRGYVVTNAREQKGKHQIHPGRTAGFRQRSGSLPHDARVQFDWPDGDTLSDGSLASLDRLARRVPYIGRSTSPAILIFSRVSDPEPLPGLTTYEPAEGPGTVSIRVPYPGYLDELDALHEANQPAWQAAGGRSRRSYREAGVEEKTPGQQPIESSYPDLVILRFVDRRPPGSLVGQFTEALRRKVMGQTEEPLPPALHGHGLPGVPHVAYLGLPLAGFEHADGQLMALAVAIPGLERAERRRILRGILGNDPDRSVSLHVPGIHGSFPLRYSPNDPLPHSATIARWIKPSRTWVSVTPLVLDRYPKDHDLVSAAAVSLAQAGLPTPRAVELSKQPMTPGAVRLRPDELPKRCRGRLYTHARVVFDQPVRGPVLAGAGRYFGVGLFAPERERER
ncbi:type I-G CRISPR-associated protein Csb2 [Propionibacterium australiense]|uniref:Cas5_6_GSU0054: CRISPR-associated protein GSU0054/csb2, Dpsyc system n=1 Tax=Propionibacterium australiense TaxID=119981 RepID=A0A383S7S5_9ACTN|nr:type I-U CRISPR-associated protein Csb2 [Propionibacterium australiense]RLP12421.1 type I-U CRISPR-associated protein Cas5/Cas6 [Propionibacterium australiense]SYZ34028.1 cas5_6_GSU0054: CRISPR-associated protein GSU0054/csb2, Dpsyc system [Propionibacterium australiense]VEH91385.1 CRISPR-associated protein GSU0054/csb2, Dpsyc system [Propionibacterium australiense]